jgi:hypothetical protein
MERAKELDPTSLVITISMVLAYDGAERWSEAEAMADQSRALDRNHPLTLTFADFLHDAMHRHLDRIPLVFRRAAQLGAWRFGSRDSAATADLERRLADPAGRPAAVREVAAADPNIGMALVFAYDGDESGLAFLNSLVGTPAAGRLTDYVVGAVLGPRRRADPRFQAVLARLGMPQS